MPLYEYICETDGCVIELIRPMNDADVPPVDPEGKGRRFVRKISTFASPGSSASGGVGGTRGSSATTGACCPCGKTAGGCGRSN